MSNLPNWFLKAPHKKVLFALGSAFLLPLCFGSLSSHVVTDIHRRPVAIASLSFAGCLLGVSSSLHSGLQKGCFGLPNRTLEFHALFAMKRYLLPCIPFGIIVLSLRAAVDSPRLSIRYMGYAAICQALLDLLSYAGGTIPIWFLKNQFVWTAVILSNLAVLSLNEAIIEDISSGMLLC